MRGLITGAAGHPGSHTERQPLTRWDDIAVFGDLSYGREADAGDAALVVISEPTPASATSGSSA